MFRFVGTLLGRAGRSLIRTFGGRGRVRITIAGPATALIPAILNADVAAAPAVAGFVKRIARPDFRLAARTASVAALNTKSGRRPRTAGTSRHHGPPVPKARLGTKKQRCAMPRKPVPASKAHAGGNVVAFRFPPGGPHRPAGLLQAA